MAESILKMRVKHRFCIPGDEKATMDVKSYENLHPNGGSIFVEKHNHCVIFPADLSIVAESVERRSKSWSVQTKLVSDLIIQLGENSFYLHKVTKLYAGNANFSYIASPACCFSPVAKLPMISRSGYINRLVFKIRGQSNHRIQIDNLPGGAKIFELVVKFCYGLKVNLTAANVAPLLCAARFLEMSDDLKQGNLISKTEDFLSFLILSSWKDTFCIFKSCESISSFARDLKILERCSEAIAWKISNYTNTSSFGINEGFLLVVAEKISDLQSKKLPSNWWFKDVSSLRIDHFIEVVASIKKKNIKPKLVGLCIAHWTQKWISGITGAKDNLKQKDEPVELHRVTTECLIRILPVEENSATCNFLLHLFKIGLIMGTDPRLLNQLESRIVFMLDGCKAEDLLIANNVTLFDIDIVVKVVQAYVSIASSNPLSKICAVGRLVDEYLVLVAKDENLPAKSFQSLVEALPTRARHCDDKLYRAIDKYLKAHPGLTEEDRSGICKVLEYHKLSQEARNHVMRNDRLPDSMTAQFILLEQVNMTRSLTTTGSYYQRTKSEAIIRVGKNLRNSRMASHSQREVSIIKQDVEKLKAQLSELQLCRTQIHRQIKKSIA